MWESRALWITAPAQIWQVAFFWTQESVAKCGGGAQNGGNFLDNKENGTHAALPPLLTGTYRGNLVALRFAMYSREHRGSQSYYDRGALLSNFEHLFSFYSTTFSIWTQYDYNLESVEYHWKHTFQFKFISTLYIQSYPWFHRRNFIFCTLFWTILKTWEQYDGFVCFQSL